MEELIQQERTVTLHLDINYESSIMIRDIKKGLKISREQVVEDAIKLLYEEYKDKTQLDGKKQTKKQASNKV